MSSSTSKLHFDRCCNPFQMDCHLKRLGLRKPSLNAKKMFPHLSDAHYLCNVCRKKVELISNENCQDVASSSEVLQQGNFIFICVIFRIHQYIL